MRFMLFHHGRFDVVCHDFDVGLEEVRNATGSLHGLMQATRIRFGAQALMRTHMCEIKMG